MSGGALDSLNKKKPIFMDLVMVLKIGFYHAVFFD